MRIFTLVIVIFLIITSCSNEDDFGLTSTQFVYQNQKWELVSMSGSIANSDTFGDDMDWQEYYIFKPDGTFLKSRTNDGNTVEAQGTFEVIKYENDPSDYLELNYESGFDLAASCLGNTVEVLIYRSLSQLSNTWLACDGPGLEYEMVKN